MILFYAAVPVSALKKTLYVAAYQKTTLMLLASVFGVPYGLLNRVMGGYRKKYYYYYY